jgi:acyl carrier protein
MTPTERTTDQGGEAASILAGIAGVAREHLGWEGPVTPDMRLVEDLRLDSIRLLTLAAEVENHFEIRLDEADEAGIETVGDLVSLVDARLVEKELAG